MQQCLPLPFAFRRQPLQACLPAFMPQARGRGFCKLCGRNAGQGPAQGIIVAHQPPLNTAGCLCRKAMVPVRMSSLANNRPNSWLS